MKKILSKNIKKGDSAKINPFLKFKECKLPIKDKKKCAEKLMTLPIKPTISSTIGKLLIVSLNISALFWIKKLEKISCNC